MTPHIAPTVNDQRRPSERPVAIDATRSWSLRVTPAQLIVIVVAIGSSVMAYTELHAHVGADGHKSSQARTAKLETAIIQISEWRTEHARTFERQTRSIERIRDNVDDIMMLQVQQAAALPPGALSSARTKQRAEKIERNVKRGAGPLDGL